MTSSLAARCARACLLSFPIVGGARASAQDTAPAPDAAPQEAAPRGLRTNAAGAFPGYTLFSPLQSATTYLIDMRGEVVHTWKTKYGPGNSDYLLGNGHLLRTARMDDGEVFHGGGIGGRIQEFDWDGALVWDYVIADDRRHQHHDIEPLPNGHVLAIVWERKTRDEVLARGRDAAQVQDVGLWPDMIFEIEPQGADGGKIVWEWHAWDHLIQDRDPKKPDFGSIPERAGLIDINADHRHDVPLTDAQRKQKAERDARMRQSGYAGGGDEDDAPGDARDDRPRRPGPGGPEGGGGPGGPRGEGDWLHVNSVDYDAANDLILLSSPRLNEIWILDHSTTSAEAASHAGGKRGHGGDLLWRWGNPRNYGAGTDKDRQLFAQHDARWLASGVPGAGHVLVFNNGQGRPGEEYSSVDELVLPFERETGFTRADNAAFGPAAPVWSYSSPKDFFSFFISGADRLPNGNTLVCEGASGRFFEVTPDARIVWEYSNPYGGDLPMHGPGGRGGPPDRRGDGPRGRDERARDGAEDGARARERNVDAPRDAQPGDDRGRGPRGDRGGRGGPGGMPRFGVFRATRIALDHPALKDRKLEVVH